MRSKLFVPSLKHELISAVVFFMLLLPLMPSMSEGQVMDNDTVSTNNDTIATAVPLGISPENPNVRIEGTLEERLEDLANAVDGTEDVDMFSMELQAGDRLTIDGDSVRYIFNGFSTGVGLDLRVFDAEGEELAYFFRVPAPDELMVSDRDAYGEITVEEAGTYYLGVSFYRNFSYDPNEAGTGAGAVFNRVGTGGYTVDVALNPTGQTVEPFVEFDGTPPAGPVVSLATSGGTFVQGNDILSTQLIETGGTGILDITFNVDGDIPAEGLEVILKADDNVSEVFNLRRWTPGVAVGGQILGGIFNADATPAGIRFLLTAKNSRFPFTGAERETDDPNMPDTITFSLANSPNHAADPAAASSTVTIYDNLEQVQAGGAPIPQVGISIDNTVLIESEGTEVTLTVTLTGEVPADGLLTYMAAENTLLGDFDVFNAVVTGGAFPAPNSNASGFFFRVFENVATIMLKVFDETTNPLIPPELALEGVEEFTVAVIPNEAYTIDPAMASVSFTILDNPDSVPLPPPPPPTDPSANPSDGDGNGTDDDAIARATPLLIGIVPMVTVEAEISQRWFAPRSPNLVDRTEDVDIFSFGLEAGQTIAVDLDSVPFIVDNVTQMMSGVLRMFDAAGVQLAINSVGAAPGEEPSMDAYLEFTAPATAIYYLGVSQSANETYDPNQAGSGNGRADAAAGIYPGDYTLELTVLP